MGVEVIERDVYDLFGVYEVPVPRPTTVPLDKDSLKSSRSMKKPLPRVRFCASLPLIVAVPERNVCNRSWAVTAVSSSRATWRTKRTLMREKSRIVALFIKDDEAAPVSVGAAPLGLADVFVAWMTMPLLVSSTTSSVAVLPSGARARTA